MVREMRMDQVQKYHVVMGGVMCQLGETIVPSYSDTHLGVAVKVFCRCGGRHNQLTLSRDYIQLSAWAKSNHLIGPQSKVEISLRQKESCLGLCVTPAKDHPAGTLDCLHFGTCLARPHSHRSQFL